jgi:hypothetical protein
VKRYGRNARQLAEREFDRDLLAGRLEDVLLRAARGGPAPASRGPRP